MMDRKKFAFLEEVAGADGASVLSRAAELGSDVEWAIFPRAVLSWVSAVTIGDGFDGQIPGTQTSLRLTKHEGRFSGVVGIDGQEYSFVDQPLSHVASSVAIAVAGVAEPAPSFVSPELVKLGKSIDLLVRARTLRKFTKVKTNNKVNRPGQTAAPLAPQAPEAPDPTAPNTNKKPNTVRVAKSIAHTDCPVCGGKRFKQYSYSGCACFRDLAKSTSSVEEGDQIVITLGKQWDQDAIRCLMEGLRS